MTDERTPDGWTGAFIIGIHRDVFGSHFPEEAGQLRTGEANFGRKAGCRPEHLDALLQQLVAQMRAHLIAIREMVASEDRLETAMTSAAVDHAEMLRIHPFVDGNGRWARIVTIAFLHDAGYPPGTIIRKADKPAYIAALDRCSDRGAPGDLATIFLNGYIRELSRRTSGR